jgi:hypothetical protein
VKYRLFEVGSMLAVDVAMVAGHAPTHSHRPAEQHRRHKLHRLLSAMPDETRAPMVQALLDAGRAGFDRSMHEQAPGLVRLAEQAAAAQIASLAVLYQTVGGSS